MLPAAAAAGRKQQINKNKEYKKHTKTNNTKKKKSNMNKNKNSKTARKGDAPVSPRQPLHQTPRTSSLLLSFSGALGPVKGSYGSAPMLVVVVEPRADEGCRTLPVPVPIPLADHADGAFPAIFAVGSTVKASDT